MFLNSSGDGYSPHALFDYCSVKFSESRGVRDWVLKMEDLRAWLLKLQASHGVEVGLSCLHNLLTFLDAECTVQSTVAALVCVDVQF